MEINGAGWYFKDKTLLPGQGHRSLAHEVSVVTLVVHGRLMERFGREEQKCSDWQLHYKPAGAVHETRTSDGARMLLLGLHERCAMRLDLARSAEPRILGSGTVSARALGLFLDLLTGLSSGEAPESDLRSLLDLVVSMEQTLPRKPGPTWLTEADELVRSSPRPHSLDNLSRRFGVHPVYLARAFRRYAGCSIGDLRRRLKVDHAARLLVRGAGPLSDVALEAGYSDHSHLCREFKRETGWSPSRFRRQTKALSRLY